MSPFYCHLYFVNKISYFILAHNNLINEQHHLYKFYKEYPTNPIQIQSPNHEKKKEMVLFVPVNIFFKIIFKKSKYKSRILIKKRKKKIAGR